MNARDERLSQRNQDIISKFIQLSNKKYKGKTKLYTKPTIFAMLSETFYLSPRTIEGIVFNKDNY